MAHSRTSLEQEYASTHTISPLVGIHQACLTKMNLIRVLSRVASSQGPMVRTSQFSRMNAETEICDILLSS